MLNVELNRDGDGRWTVDIFIISTRSAARIGQDLASCSGGKHKEISSERYSLPWKLLKSFYVHVCPLSYKIQHNWSSYLFHRLMSWNSSTVSTASPSTPYFSKAIITATIRWPFGRLEAILCITAWHAALVRESHQSDAYLFNLIVALCASLPVGTCLCLLMDKT